MSFGSSQRPRLKRREQSPAPEVEEEEKSAKPIVPKLSEEARSLISIAPKIRPTHNPTELSRYQVAQMSAMNITQEEIAVILGINKDTLYKYYRQELDYGKSVCTAQVGMRLYKVATEAEGREAITAMIFWLKSRAGWKDNIGMEVSGPDGSPIAIESLTLSHEERATRVLQLLNARSAQRS